MIASLDALMHGIIDYAGLFPPAKLTMTDAVRSYLKYIGGRETFLVRRFVCPVTRLSEFESALGRMAYEKPVPIAAIGRGGENAQELLRNTIADLATLSRSALRAVPEVFEVRIPPAAMNPKDIGMISVEMKRRKAELQVYLEIPFTEKWETEIPMALETIAITQATGAKVRTGGLEPAAVPSPEQLSLFIYEAARNQLEMKATAGLHRAVRHFDESVGCDVHGFFNVFVSAAVAYTQQAPRSLIEAIIEQTDIREFIFEKDGLSCNSPLVPVTQIVEARRFARSFGSCSVDEPVQDLVGMGQPLGAIA